MSSPILPQEILDAVIDLLAEPLLNLSSSIESLPSPAQLNIESLKACSLVSQAFAHRAQPYIFALFKLSTDAEMTEEEKLRRIERRGGVVRLFEQKPHIMRGIHGISIDLVNKDAQQTLFQVESQVDNDLIYALTKVPSPSFLHAHGGRRNADSIDSWSYLRVHLLPLNFGMLTTLVISEFNFDFATVAFMPALRHLSMTCLRFIPDDDPLPPKSPRTSEPTRLFIREFQLTDSRGDMLDVITDNIMGTGPRHYPILDFSTVRSLQLGDHDARGDDVIKYLSALWRLLGYCAHSVENLGFSNRYMCNFNITQPFVPVGGKEFTTLGLQHMAHLRSLALKGCPINLLLRTGHNALDEIIYLINSLPTDNQVSSLTLQFDVESGQDLSFSDLSLYADWAGLAACLNRITDERLLTTLKFSLHWTLVVDDLSLVNRARVNDTASDMLRGLDENVIYSLRVEPPDLSGWSATWNAVDKASYNQALVSLYGFTLPN